MERSLFFYQSDADHDGVCHQSTHHMYRLTLYTSSSEQRQSSQVVKHLLCAFFCVPNFPTLQASMFSVRRTLLAVCLLVVAASLSSNTEAFVTSPSSNSLTKKQHLNAPKTASALHERKWNFNEGQGPWGLKKNAEIWNGRIAQVC